MNCTVWFGLECLCFLFLFASVLQDTMVHRIPDCHIHYRLRGASLVARGMYTVPAALSGLSFAGKFPFVSPVCLYENKGEVVSFCRARRAFVSGVSVVLSISLKPFPDRIFSVVERDGAVSAVWLSPMKT